MYYVTNIRHFNDETPTVKTITEFDTKDMAIIDYHNLVGAGMVKKDIKDILVMITNEVGAPELMSTGGEYREYWVAPVPEPEPEPEPEEA